MLKKVFFILIIFIFSVFAFFKFANPETNTKIAEILFLKYFKYDMAKYFLEKSILQNVGLDKFEQNNLKNHFLLGRIYFVENKLEKSIKSYTQTIDICEKHTESDEFSTTCMQAYYGRGLSYGFYMPIFLDNARSDFQKYIDMEALEFTKTESRSSGVWAGYNDLAWIYFMQNNLPKSEEIVRKGLEISPTNPWLLNLLGSVLMGQEKKVEAKTALENALFYLGSISPESWGEAYTGDNSKFYKQGRDQMQKTIVDNLENLNLR